MGDNSKIEWTDASWNPIRARRGDMVGWYCERISEGCRNCYAEGMNMRLGTGLPYKPRSLEQTNIFLDEKMLLQPLRWKKPRMIFVGSMTDLFADFVKDEWLDKIFAVMALCPQHTFQVLTKRPARMRKYMSPTCDLPILGRLPLERVHFEAQSDVEPWQSLKRFRNLYSLYCSVPWPLPNVWLGVSAEDDAAYRERWGHIAAAPAAIRFLSYEPALGPLGDLDLGRVGAPNWVICGGESGPNARPVHPDWARLLRDQCAAACIPFFFKQWGGWAPDLDPHTDKLVAFADGSPMVRVGKKAAGRLLDGREHMEWPEARP